MSRPSALREFSTALIAYANAYEANLSGESRALHRLRFAYFNDPVVALWTGLRATLAVVLVGSLDLQQLAAWVDRGDPRGGGNGTARDNGARSADFRSSPP